jgi:hypothetical protein
MKTKKRLRMERDMAVAKLTAARQERTLYIRALEEKVRPLLDPAPTYSPDPKTCGRPFEVVMHGLDGETLSWIFLAPDQGYHQELFLPITVTGFTVIAPSVEEVA